MEFNFICEQDYIMSFTNALLPKAEKYHFLIFTLLCKIYIVVHIYSNTIIVLVVVCFVF